ncbi:hypothetical protein ScPMuIL_014518 [Solemya velum]
MWGLLSATVCFLRSQCEPVSGYCGNENCFKEVKKYRRGIERHKFKRKVRRFPPEGRQTRRSAISVTSSKPDFQLTAASREMTRSRLPHVIGRHGQSQFLRFF